MEAEHEFLEKFGVNTLHDWIFNPQFGITTAHGAIINNLGYYETLKEMNGGSVCKIGFLNLHSLGLTIRFPLTAIMCIIGVIIGLKGFLFFTKHSFKFSVSFIFYASMNLNGLFYHSLIPIHNQYRILFAMGDKGSTGVSGLFLALGLLSILYSPNNKSCESSSNKVKFILLICVMFLLCNIPMLDDYIYIFGCSAVFYAGVQIFKFAKKGNKVNQYLTKIGEWTFVILIATLLLPIASNYSCGYKNYLNLMSGFFALCDVGFIIIFYYISKYYIAANNLQQKKKQ